MPGRRFAVLVALFDWVSGRIVFDGLAGTRTDSFPSLSIANGAPTGAGATNTLVLTWPDGAVNQERALVQTSTNQGVSWSAPVNAAQAGDRPDNPAVAISPDGTTCTWSTTPTWTPSGPTPPTRAACRGRAPR